MDVVELQVSEDSAAVTVNAGVLHPGAYEACWGVPPPDKIREELCTVRFRSGQPSFGADVWWSIDDASIDAILTEALVQEVVPFLDEMHKPEKMELFLRGEITSQKHPYAGAVIYLAALEAARGAVDDGCNTLKAYERQVAEGWRPRFSQAATRLRCSA